MNTNVTTQPAVGTASDVAAIQQCSVRHVHNMDKRGLMPRPVRIGHLKRWGLDEIRDWLRAGCPDRQAWETGKMTGGK